MEGLSRSTATPTDEPEPKKSMVEEEKGTGYFFLYLHHTPNTRASTVTARKVAYPLSFPLLKVSLSYPRFRMLNNSILTPDSIFVPLHLALSLNLDYAFHGAAPFLWCGVVVV